MIEFYVTKYNSIANIRYMENNIMYFYYNGEPTIIANAVNSGFLLNIFDWEP